MYYEEKKFGGRYFTIKRTNEDNVESLIINVSDILETIKEVKNTGVPIVKKLDEYFKEQDFKKAIIELCNYLIISTINMEIKLIGNFDIDLKLVDWNKDFEYEYTVKVNRFTKILNFKVKKQGWTKEFVEAFIADYTNRIKKEKNEKQ